MAVLLEETRRSNGKISDRYTNATSNRLSLYELPIGTKVLCQTQVPSHDNQPTQLPSNNGLQNINLIHQDDPNDKNSSLIGMVNGYRIIYSHWSLQTLNLIVTPLYATLYAMIS